jgi:hypothetical protein
MVSRLRRINPVQFALVTAILYAIFTFIVALLILPFSAIMSSTAAGQTPAMRMFGAGMGVMMVILLPLVYFVISFIFGLIGAALYNLVAGWTGGVEIMLESPVAAAAAVGDYPT